MANKLYEESCITDIGRAIQIQLNTSSSFSVAGMAAAVLMIGGGNLVLESLSCSINGTYTPQGNVDGFSEVVVSVPGGASAALISKNISANGTYHAANDGADGFSDVVVNVIPNLVSLSVSENGNYILPPSPDPSDPVGFDNVVVNVPTGSSIASLGACLSGDSIPSSSIGNVGDLYIYTTPSNGNAKFRYFRLIITKVRNSGSGCQISKLFINDYGWTIEEEDPGDPPELIYYPEAAHIWVNSDGEPVDAGHLPQNLFDFVEGTVYSTSHNPSVNNPIIITIDFGDFLIDERASVTNYSWGFGVTNNSDCDPVSFAVQLSPDGVNWYTFDQQTDYNTENGYFGTFSDWPASTFIRDIYIKETNTWKKAVGIDVTGNL